MTNVPISEFVDWYSRKTGKGVIVPNDFNEKITVYNSDISPENLPAFFVSVMASRGYEVSPGNPVIITKSHQGNYGISALDKALENPLPEGSSLNYLPDYPEPKRDIFLRKKRKPILFIMFW
nr:hypothetical protein ARN_33060 [Arsenophonus nasoniae]